MSAGTGIRHSEFNASQTEPVHFLQIWIVPDRTGLAPGYAETTLDDGASEPRLQRVAGRHADGPGALGIGADVEIYRAKLSRGEVVRHEPGRGRIAWLQVVSGEAALNGRGLAAGDGAGVEDEVQLSMEGLGEGGEVLLFDMPGPSQ